MPPHDRHGGFFCSVTHGHESMRAPRKNGGRLAASAILLVLIIAAPSIVSAQSVAFPRKGAFEGCLDLGFRTWVQTQAELLVNEDPRAQRVDDRTVANWTVGMIDGCRMIANGSDEASEEIFNRHMARWREHIFEVANTIRRRGQSD